MTEVPVTMGLRVRSVALESDEEVEEGARGAPPADRDRDIICMSRRKTKVVGK